MKARFRRICSLIACCSMMLLSLIGCADPDDASSDEGTVDYSIIGGEELSQEESEEAIEEVLAKISEAMASDPILIHTAEGGFDSFKPTVGPSGNVNGRVLDVDLVDAYIGTKQSHFVIGMTTMSFFSDGTSKSHRTPLGFWAEKQDGEWVITDFTDETRAPNQNGGA